MANRSLLLAARDFTLIAEGRLEIAGSSKRIAVHFEGSSLFVDDQIIDVNQTDKPEPLALPFLDTKLDFFGKVR